jgi:hypothetical protein
MIFCYAKLPRSFTHVWRHIKNMTLGLQIKELKQASQWQCNEQEYMEMHWPRPCGLRAPLSQHRE